MYTTGVRRPGHEGRSTSQLTDQRRSRRHPLSAPKPSQRARLVGRWTVTEAGRLTLQWSLARSEPAHRSIAGEEAMVGLDDSRSTPRARVSLVA